MPRENTTQGISFPPTLLAQAKQQAAAKGLSVSGYVQALIRDDLTQPDARLTREIQEKILLRLQELDQRGTAERPTARKKPGRIRATGVSSSER
jgi:hypothetical protein